MVIYNGKDHSFQNRKDHPLHKKLKVKIDSAPLKNELNLSKSKVLEILEKELGKGVIEDIVFT